jgi:hypothetical protein
MFLFISSAIPGALAVFLTAERVSASFGTAVAASFWGIF